MPDQLNIDVNINPNALKEIPQLKTSLDSLRDSVVNLNKEILNYNKQSQETVTWGNKIKTTVKDLADTYESFGKLIDIAKKSFQGWEGILSAAFTLITTYGPQVLDYLGDMFQSDKTRQAAQALKDYKAVMESYIDKVSVEISKMQILVNIANSKTLSDQAKLEAIKKLNQLSPEHLNYLTKENIKTKEGKEALDEYTKALKRKAMEEALQEQRAPLEKKREQSKAEYESALKDRIAYNTGKIQNTPGRSAHEYNGVFVPATDDAKTAANKRFAKLAEDDDKLVSQIKSLDDKFTADLVKLAPNPNNKTIHNKEYYEIQLAEQQAILDGLDAGAKGFEKKAAASKSRIESINKVLAAYSVVSVKKSGKKPQSVPEEARAPIDALQAKSIDFAKTVELDKQHYDTEQALLDEQRKNKLISQEAYQHQSQALEEKYHLAIGDKIKVFSETELADAQKHMQDLDTINRHDDTIAKDEHDVKKAILPLDKLDAEKKLIEDKYSYEIALAGNNKEKIKQLREQQEQDVTALTKRYEEERKAFAIQTAQKVSDTAFSILKGSIQSQADAKIKGLETQKQAELSNSSLTADQKRAIEDKYKKKEAEEKVKAFKAEQKASILQAVINGALAITKATSQTGVLAPFVIPGIIVETAIQVATIAKQKAPQYAKGGMHYQSDGRGALLSGYSRTDDTNAYLRSGEAVVVSEAMRNPWARNLVSAINVAHGGRDFSMSNPGRGYAIGGVFTDGGNANRYYSQPANDAKDLANTLAYQMINNFPPIYVDVKDVNNQQNILAQTVNRVNL